MSHPDVIHTSRILAESIEPGFIHEIFFFKYMTNQKCGTMSNTADLIFKSQCYNNTNNKKTGDSSRLKWTQMAQQANGMYEH